MPTRREVLAGLGALAVGCARGDDSGDVGPDPRTPEPDAWPGRGEADSTAFPVGVQSGDPLPDGAIVWTRYDGAEAVALIVATWDGAAWVESEVAVVVVDGFVHHEVGAVGADAPVAFQFRDAGGALFELRSDGTARIVAVDEDDVVLFDGEITVDGRVLSASIVHPTA